MTKHVVFTIGTRPEGIKTAPLIRSFSTEPSWKVTVLSTGQHMEMLYQVLQPFDIKTDNDLRLMEPSQTPNLFMARALSVLEKEYHRLQPDLILVQGDTSTVLAASLAAYHLHIPIAHIEAGLRTHDLTNPFPEEANRCLTDKLSSYHFCPTLESIENLKKENISSQHIFLCGNTIVDALKWLKKEEVLTLPSRLRTLSSHQQFILLTLHRRENQGPILESICYELMEFIEANPDQFIYFPVHLNPRVQTVVHSILKHPRIILDRPIDYFQLLGVMERCSFIITDSGGIQEEAPSFNKFVLVLRKKTERPETIKEGIGTLFSPEKVGLADYLTECLKRVQPEKVYPNPFGDGKASQRIKAYLLWNWGFRQEKPQPFNPRLATK